MRRKRSFLHPQRCPPPSTCQEPSRGRHPLTRLITHNGTTSGKPPRNQPLLTPGAGTDPSALTLLTSTSHHPHSAESVRHPSAPARLCASVTAAPTWAPTHGGDSANTSAASAPHTLGGEQRVAEHVQDFNFERMNALYLRMFLLHAKEELLPTHGGPPQRLSSQGPFP